MTKSALIFLYFSFFLLFGCSDYHNPEDLFPHVGQRKLTSIQKDGLIWQKFLYNDKGNQIQATTYYSVEDSIIFLFSYDEKDRLITRQMPYQKDTLIYDETGRLTTMITSWPGSSRVETIHYSWSKGRITIGRVYVDDNLVNTIDFKYDSKGNTIRRKCQLTGYTFEYDDKLRPAKDMVHYPIDIIQKNNPVKTYYFNAVMSSFPPNYEHIYEYNSEGFPVREFRTDLRTKLTSTLEYFYSE